MFYFLPTKRGIGIEIWGTYDDLRELYEFTGNFWNETDGAVLRGSENRDSTISAFSYELRHAFQGDRLTGEISHLTYQPGKFLGLKISWVHLLFTLSALKHNMSSKHIGKHDISTLLRIEFWVEKAIQSFDSATSPKLIPFINGAIYGSNDCLYQFMRHINMEYISLGGGKRNFKKLPLLLDKSIYGTDSYKFHMEFLKNEGLRTGSKPEDLELDDDDFDYEKLEW